MILSILTLNILNRVENYAERLDLFGEELKRLGELDVICLQEVLYDDEELELLRALAHDQNFEIVLGDNPQTGPVGQLFGNATLVKKTHSIVHMDSLQYSASPETLIVNIVTPSGDTIQIVNVHLAWGGTREHVRLEQVREINAYVNTPTRNPVLTTYFAGDFNTTPDSDTLRYLKGLLATPENPAYWSDLWEAHHPLENGYTTRTDDQAELTALAQGIVHPHMMPLRRIDYILMHGWEYGRPYYPRSIELFDTGTPAISDHYGVIAR